MPSIDPQAESLFAAAAELSGEARKAFLDRECAGQEELRGQLEGLLRAHDRVNHAVDRPAIHQDRLEATCLADAQAVGAVIAGRYKLLEQIGDGGMGTVWMAEQREPVKRLVAVKLIKPGMDSKAVLARFEAERQALALMDHPNIAKVHDAGTDESGRPYFVMELVKGLPLTEYCDARKLTVNERLHLFVQICSAVQHAHQKAVIHRDLKPTNVLVTEHDGKPVPKVIDFGLAKALNASQMLTERTLHTAYGTVVGTPLYMAPEQVGINALDVDTRTDIYALGVILYELLTGTTPLEKARFKEAAWEEVKRLIREDEPPRPSTRLSSDKTLASLAASRQVDPAQLPRLVRGELDWIVMKALDKDRARRYETANGLAKDVQRYLAGDAVEACPPSLSYRLQKLFRRNRTAVLTAIAFAGVLVIATGVSVTFGIRAGQAARLAQEEATQKQLALLSADKQRERAEQTISQMLEVFDTQISETAADSLVSQSTITREQRQLYEAAIQYYQLLLEQPETGGAMRSRIAAAALKLGSIYGRIGDEQKAKDALAIALDALTRLIAESPENREHLYSQLAECHQGLGRLNQSDDIDVSIDHLQKARDLLDALIKSAPANDKPGFQLAKANCLLSLGKTLHMKDVADKINPLREFKDAEVVMKQLTEEHPGNHEYLFGLFKAKQNKIIFKGRTGDRSDRAPSLKELIGILKQLLDAPEIDVNQRNRYRGLLSVVLHNLARTYQETSQLVVADQLYCKAIEILEESIADLPGDLHARVYLGRMHVSRGITQAAMGHRDNAVAGVENARRIHQETLGRVGQPNSDLSFELAVAEGCLGQLLRDKGNPSGSRTYIEVAIENARKAKVRDPLPMHGMGTELHWLGELAITNDRLKKYDEALKVWEESIRFCEASKQQDAAAFYQLGRLATEIQSGAISSDQAVTDAEKLGFPSEPVTSFDQLHEARQYLVVRFFAIAAKHSPAGREARDKYANVAVDWLKALVNQSGPCFVGLTPGNVDFDVLRSYDKFKEFEQSIADKKGVRDSELEETLGLDTTDCPGQ